MKYDENLDFIIFHHISSYFIMSLGVLSQAINRNPKPTQTLNPNPLNPKPLNASNLNPTP